LIWWSCEFCVLKFCNNRGAFNIVKTIWFSKVNHHLNWNKYLNCISCFVTNNLESLLFCGFSFPFYNQLEVYLHNTFKICNLKIIIIIIIIIIYLFYFKKNHWITHTQTLKINWHLVFQFWINQSPEMWWRL
jgi:hypothetical protein